MKFLASYLETVSSFWNLYSIQIHLHELLFLKYGIISGLTRVEVYMTRIVGI